MLILKQVRPTRRKIVMPGFIQTCVLLALGALGFIAYQYIHQAVHNRLNYGKKVWVDRRRAGFVVSCRFNGYKKYFYVNEDYELVTKDEFSNKKNAYEACQEAFRASRPKQSVYGRVPF
jgi:hypothetical protein